MKKDKLRSTKHTHKTKDQVTGTPLKTGGELRSSGKVSSSCSSSVTRRVYTVKANNSTIFNKGNKKKIPNFKQMNTKRGP